MNYMKVQFIYTCTWANWKRYNDYHATYKKISCYDSMKDNIKIYIFYHLSIPSKVTCFETVMQFEFAKVITETDRHDDVIKWKHFPRYWPFVRGIHRSPVNSPHKGQWRGALMFTLICARINGWVNNCEAGDLRCNRAHYDVIVMHILILGYGTGCSCGVWYPLIIHLLPVEWSVFYT